MENSADPTLVVKTFTRDTFTDWEKQPDSFAVVKSARPRRVKALGDMEFDAQVAFVSTKTKNWGWQGEKALSERANGIGQINLMDVFSETKALDHQEATVAFFPRKQEDAAILTLTRHIEQWGDGNDEEAWGYDKTGWVIIGLNFTPGGMMLAMASSMHVMDVVYMSQKEKEDPFFLSEDTEETVRLRDAAEPSVFGEQKAFAETPFYVNAWDFAAEPLKIKSDDGPARDADLFDRMTAKDPRKESLDFMAFLRGQAEAQELKRAIQSVGGEGAKPQSEEKDPFAMRAEACEMAPGSIGRRELAPRRNRRI